MNRPYLILLFAAALLLVMIGWGLYSKLTPPPPAPVQPATAPLVERLRIERERRIRERGESPGAATQPPTTAPAPAVPAD